MEASKSSTTTVIVSSPYRRILLFHMMDQKCLIGHSEHAMYVAKMANAEIVIFHVMETDSIYLQAHYWHS
jgi:hypothetical protein